MALILTRYLCISSESDQEGDFNLSIKEILPFAAPIILFSAGITILMSLDLFLVKSLLRSNDQTGFYTAATMIGKLPYHFIVSFTLTLFPSVSRAHAQNNLEKIRHYIRRFAKYITHIMLPTVTIISILASEIITIIYSKRFIPSSQPLSIIIWGNAFLAYFLFCSTIFMAIGRPKVPFFFLCISLPLAIILNLHLIPKYNLIGAALATTLSHLAGLILSSWSVIKCLNISISIKTIFVTMLGISSILISSYLLPLQGGVILIKCFILFLVYITIMLICKEINIEDIKNIKEVFIKS
ncbi:MAG: polysaccharide biosynthesis C-terminal domain-containing protein [bacterium]